ncbi:unnamed protein product [Durusdinium trenchii]|uniref:Knr4/Smi1-like domain-containing protein n=2 Tax=Durusdinium trenchii TaxID=1381693 RepID=A0ABP0MN10_9DINO
MGNAESCESCCSSDLAQLKRDADWNGRRPERYPAAVTDLFETPAHSPRDPRFQLADFLESGDDRGPAGCLRQRNLHVNENRTHWFAVFRPTSVDAIQKMMNGDGTGKGLNIKGKSAKTGRLSGFVPVLQISQNEHKKQLCTSPKSARVRIYMASEESCHSLQLRMQKVLDEMVRLAAAAQALLEAHKAGSIDLSEEQMEEAYTQLGLEVEDPTINLLQQYEPEANGLEIPERLFREVYVQRADISRSADWQTGRPSEPAFMDMNLHTLRDSNAQPRAVIWQQDMEDCLNPSSLLMAYEEEKGPMNFQPLPQEQVEIMKWSLGQILEVLERPGSSGWMSRWLEILKRESDKGFHPEMPRFGFGDPTSYEIVGEFVTAMGLLGAVRHGAECFNFYFPQDLDDEFLVISGTFGAEPWRYMKEPELREFLMDSISQGYSFPLNPKWIICDAGWRDVFQQLRAGEGSQKHLASWFPPDSGLMDTIDELCQKFPEGFTKPTGVLEMDIDLAEFQLKRYETLQRAKRKLRACLRWRKINEEKVEKQGEKKAVKDVEEQLTRIEEGEAEDVAELPAAQKIEEPKKPSKRKKSCLGCCSK